MEFVESIEREGLVLDRKPMGAGVTDHLPILIEVETESGKKDIDELDIEIPLMTPRTYREYKNLSEMNVHGFGHQRVAYLQFSEEEQRHIVFKDITTGEITHTTTLDTAGIADYRSVVGYFAQTIMKELRLVSGYDVLYGQLKQFIADELFAEPIDLESPNTIRNLSELPASRTVIQSFKKAINALTVRDRGDAEIKDHIKLRNTRPFQVKNQPYVLAKRSVFNRIIGDQGFELAFAAFLDNCPGVRSFTKNFFAVGFKLDYVKADGDISTYTPDFIVKTDPGDLWIIETKGREELDLPMKMARLRQWCDDLNGLQSATKYGFIYVPQDEFEKSKPRTFADLEAAFREFR
jgi:type III restriction enzyme